MKEVEVVDFIVKKYRFTKIVRDHRGRYRMVVGFITSYAISAYHH